jgi:hypothetical protein
MFAIIKAFIAGFVSTLTFHQGLLWFFHHNGMVNATPWNLTPVPPLGVPAVVSLAFWGGLWGIIIWLLIRRALAAGYYVGAIILGAIGPTVVAFTLVPWLEHHAVAADINPHTITIALALNGAWGLGLALFMRIMNPPR